MKTFSVPIRERLRSIDFLLLALVILMTLMSVVTLIGDKDSLSGTRRIFMQSGASLVGLGAVLFLSCLDYGLILKRYFFVILAGSVILMLITVVFGRGYVEDSTNRCWLFIGGFSIQPSEFVKIAFILTLAKHLELVEGKIDSPLTLLPLMAHAGLVIGLVLVTGDLGSGLIFIVIVAAMLFVAGLSLWYFAGAFLLLIMAFPFLWTRLLPYQQNRILAGFQPEVDPTYAGYQALKSRQAIAAGGFRGAGLFGGTYYKSVPAHVTDCFFSMVCEKFGFIGAMVYILLLLLLVLRLLNIAQTANTRSGTFICIGVAALIIAQSVENIGMCLGVLPVVGITLPFLSYGGSSMLASYLYLGVVQSVVTHNRKPLPAEITI